MPIGCVVGWAGGLCPAADAGVLHLCLVSQNLLDNLRLTAPAFARAAELHKSMLEMASFLASNKVLRPDGTQVRHLQQAGPVCCAMSVTTLDAHVWQPGRCVSC